LTLNNKLKVNQLSQTLIKMKNLYYFKRTLIFLSLSLFGMTGYSQLATVSIDSVYTIADVYAYCSSNVTDIGGSAVTERGICWSSTSNPPTILDSKATDVAGGSGTYDLLMSPLTAGTLYHVRAYAVNTSGTAYSSVVDFTTYATGSDMYACDAENDILIDANTYQFDVNIYSVSGQPQFYLNNYQLAFEVWNVGTASGTLTGSYIAGTSQLPAGFTPTSSPLIFRADNHGGPHFDMVIPGPAPQSAGVAIPVPGYRIGTFQIVYHSGGAPAPFPNVRLNMIFDNDVLGKTVIYTWSAGTGPIKVATNMSSHRPRAIAATYPYTLPMDNHTLNAANWEGTTDTDWNTGTNWIAEPSTLLLPPTSSEYVSIPGTGLTNYPNVSTRTTPACNHMIIADGGKITIASNGDLTVNGNLSLGTTTGGPLTVKSDATATGSLITKGTITGTGVATSKIERYITGNWSGGNPTGATIWHYVSAPISDATINTFLGFLMNSWSESALTWIPLTTPVTTLMNVGQGYAVATTANGTVTYTGTLNTGDITISGLTNSGGGGSTYSGWHLIGNPYPSSFTWDGSITRTNVDGGAYFWNGSTYVAYMTTDGTPYQIPADQGFFVHTTGAGSVAIPNTNRVHSTGSFVKSTVTDQLTLKVAGNSYEDKTSIRFNEQATENFDGEYDAYKLFGIEACPQIYSIIQEDILAINSLPDPDVHPVIKLGLKVGESGLYTISASDIESFKPGTSLYIEDILTEKDQSLNTNPVYTFNAEPGQPEHRFNIHFAPVGINEKESDNIRIYSSEKDIYVNIPTSTQGNIIVYNLLGSEMMRKPFTGKSFIKLTPDVNSGYYLVQVAGDRQTATGKVYLH